MVDIILLRAVSTEPRDTLTVTPMSRTPARTPSLKKRSISLEQTTKEQVNYIYFQILLSKIKKYKVEKIYLLVKIFGQ